MRRWQDDPHTKKARKQGLLARSVFKLDELDRKFKLVRGAKRIIDLGASPGSWTQYCLKTTPKAQIFAIDLKKVEVDSPQLSFLLQDIAEVDWDSFLGDQKVDLVLSDMAPNTTGNTLVDHSRSIQLCELALEVACSHLKPGGHFAVKVFMGEDFESFRANVSKHFGKVELLRPDSTRKQSKEIFLVGKGFTT